MYTSPCSSSSSICCRRRAFVPGRWPGRSSQGSRSAGTAGGAVGVHQAGVLQGAFDLRRHGIERARQARSTFRHGSAGGRGQSWPRLPQAGTHSRRPRGLCPICPDRRMLRSVHSCNPRKLQCRPPPHCPGGTTLASACSSTGGSTRSWPVTSGRCTRRAFRRRNTVAWPIASIPGTTTPTSGWPWPRTRACAT